MDAIFSFRLDEETSVILQVLAERTFRSRAGVVRLLIHNAALGSGLLFPNANELIAHVGDVALTPLLDDEHRKVQL